jgi:hypothetical protein
MAPAHQVVQFKPPPPHVIERTVFPFKTTETPAKRRPTRFLRRPELAVQAIRRFRAELSTL